MGASKRRVRAPQDQNQQKSD